MQLFIWSHRSLLLNELRLGLIVLEDLGLLFLLLLGIVIWVVVRWVILSRGVTSLKLRVLGHRGRRFLIIRIGILVLLCTLTDMVRVSLLSSFFYLFLSIWWSVIIEYFFKHWLVIVLISNLNFYRCFLLEFLLVLLFLLLLMLPCVFLILVDFHLSCLLILSKWLFYFFLKSLRWLLKLRIIIVISLLLSSL